MGVILTIFLFAVPVLSVVELVMLLQLRKRVSKQGTALTGLVAGTRANVLDQTLAANGVSLDDVTRRKLLPREEF